MESKSDIIKEYQEAIEQTDDQQLRFMLEQQLRTIEESEKE